MEKVDFDSRINIRIEDGYELTSVLDRLEEWGYKDKDGLSFKKNKHIYMGALKRSEIYLRPATGLFTYTKDKFTEDSSRIIGSLLLNVDLERATVIGILILLYNSSRVISKAIDDLIDKEIPTLTKLLESLSDDTLKGLLKLIK